MGGCEEIAGFERCMWAAYLVLRTKNIGGLVVVEQDTRGAGTPITSKKILFIVCLALHRYEYVGVRRCRSGREGK